MDERRAEQGEGASRGRTSPVGAPLSDEIRTAAAEVTERVLTALLGRIISPRIRLLDIGQVCEATGLGKSTIYALVEEGKFPEPQKNLGKNLWRESALIAWADRNDPNEGGE